MTNQKPIISRKSAPCHPEKEYHAKGLCKSCWQKANRALPQGKAVLTRYNSSEKGKISRKKALDTYRKTGKYKEKSKISRRAYKQANKAKLNDKRKARKVNDPVFKLSINLRSRLYSALKRGSFKGSAVRDLGCSLNFLKSYLESLFQPGMTWDNWTTEGWHIDHIIPLATAKTPEDMIKLCHYTNLQPLWAVDNLSKSWKHD
jgi:hypothetical protein